MANKVQAFTIIEVMVTVVITSVVILLSLSVYSSYKRVFMRFNEGVEANYQLMLFDKQLEEDIKSIPEMIFEDGRLVFQSKIGDKVLYCFNDSIIVRENGERLDTFFIAYTNLEFSYLFNSVINEFSFRSISGNTEYYSSKEYSNAYLINKEVFYGN